MKNIKCVIEARMGSKRLPGKSMMNLLGKYKLIDYTIQSALNSIFLSNKNVYLLTSKNLDFTRNQKMIDVLEKLTKKEVVTFYQDFLKTKARKLSIQIYNSSIDELPTTILDASDTYAGVNSTLITDLAYFKDSERYP